jgi:esterase/lipase superfamily enzyme
MHSISGFLQSAETMRESTGWYSTRLQRDITLIRWGHWGPPLLLFPTAGGDAAEAERFDLIAVLGPQIEAGRVKVYSIDSIAGRTWMNERHNPAHCVWMQRQFDACVREEVVPAIRNDCRSDSVEIMTAGASIGAFNALTTICRHPDVFSRAICLSGTFDLEHWLGGQWFDDFHFLSPVHFVPGLSDGEQLRRLRQRFIILATGQGRYENPGETWKAAHALGSKGIPNRVDLWDAQWEHDWPTWRAMLPQYVAELVG